MNYHDPQTWNNYDATHQAAARIKAIRSFIPKDVQTILDAGCGNGLIANELCDSFQVTGIDSSLEALKYLKCPAQQASLTQIPFPDKSFDLVMCNEVLEHLDNVSLHQAISELLRVCDKHLLIGVPHREQLDNLLVRCARCGHEEHPYGHLQSFSLNALNQLIMPSGTYRKHLIFGPDTRDYHSLLLKLRHKVVKQWFRPYDGWSCSRCGSSSYLAKSSLFSMILNTLNRVVSKSRPYWLMVLYSKQEKQ